MTQTARRSSAAALSDINITPLIDVMLVLLIIFMVVTPTATQSLDASLPQMAEKGKESAAEALVLEVTMEGLRLNRSAITGFDELGERLRDIFSGRSDKTLFLRAEGTARYASVVAALDVARGAGAERIGILGPEGTTAR